MKSAEEVVMLTIDKKWKRLIMIALFVFAPMLGCGGGGHTNTASNGGTPPPTGGGSNPPPVPPPSGDWDTIDLTVKVKNATADGADPFIGAVNWGQSYGQAHLDVSSSENGWAVYDGSYTPDLYPGIYFNGDDICMFVPGPDRDSVRFWVNGQPVKWYTEVDGRKNHQCAFYQDGKISEPHIAHKSLDDVSGTPVPPPTQGTTVYTIDVTYSDTNIAPNGEIKDVFMGYSDVAGDWHDYTTTDTHQIALHSNKFQWQVTNGGKGLSTIFVQPSEARGNKDFDNVTNHKNGINELRINGSLVCWNIKGKKASDGIEHAWLKKHMEGNELVLEVDANRHAVIGGVQSDGYNIKMPPHSVNGFDEHGNPTTYEVVAGAGWGSSCPGNFPVK